MKKMIYTVVLTLITFTILNFFYSNLGGEAFNYPLSFQFSIPYLFTLRSAPIPLGFVIISSFCLGMIFLPLLQLFPWIFRSRELRSKEKRIRQLEGELETVRSKESLTPDQESVSSSVP